LGVLGAETGDGVTVLVVVVLLGFVFAFLVFVVFLFGLCCVVGVEFLEWGKAVLHSELPAFAVVVVAVVIVVVLVVVGVVVLVVSQTVFVDWSTLAALMVRVVVMRGAVTWAVHALQLFGFRSGHA
jgi:hypothetical protein